MADEDGTGAPNDPEHKKPKAGSYRHPLSSNEEIRRAGEQTSPQVARAAGHPRKLRDEGGELGSGSSSIRRFLFEGLKFNGGTGKDR